MFHPKGTEESSEEEEREKFELLKSAIIDALTKTPKNTLKSLRDVKCVNQTQAAVDELTFNSKLNHNKEPVIPKVEEQPLWY